MADKSNNDDNKFFDVSDAMQHVADSLGVSIKELEETLRQEAIVLDVMMQEQEEKQIEEAEHFERRA